MCGFGQSPFFLLAWRDNLTTSCMRRDQLYCLQLHLSSPPFSKEGFIWSSHQILKESSQVFTSILKMQHIQVSFLLIFRENLKTRCPQGWKRCYPHKNTPDKTDTAGPNCVPLNAPACFTAQSCIVHVMHSWLDCPPPVLCTVWTWQGWIRHLRDCNLCCLSDVVPFPPPSKVFDGLGDLLMPAVTPQSTGGSTAGSMGTPMTPGIAAVPPATPPPGKTIGGVLDSALDNLIGGKWKNVLSGVRSLWFIIHKVIFDS